MGNKICLQVRNRVISSSLIQLSWVSLTFILEGFAGLNSCVQLCYILFSIALFCEYGMCLDPHRGSCCCIHRPDPYETSIFSCLFSFRNLSSSISSGVLLYLSRVDPVALIRLIHRSRRLWAKSCSRQISASDLPMLSSWTICCLNSSLWVVFLFCR